MRRLNIVLIIFLFLFFKTFSQNKQNKKHIKSEEIIEFDLLKKDTAYYKGNRVALTGFGDDHLMKYDSIGNLIERYILYLNSEPVLNEKYEYNTLNQITTSYKYKTNSNLFWTSTNKYDNNKLIQNEFKVEENSVGYENSYSLYFYLEGENDFIEDYYNGDLNKGILSFIKETIKDEHNNISYIALYHPDNLDKPFQWNSYKYDSNNNEIENVSTSRKESYTFKSYYNSKNDCIKLTHIGDNNLKESIYELYEYTYDEYNNWITKKTKKEGNVVGSFFERNIVYY
jgi:hypothetical protein